jgi:hypothetical protein
MQEQGKGKAPTGFYEIHPLGRITLSGEGGTVGHPAKIRIIHGNKKWLTFWTREGIINIIRQQRQRSVYDN